MKRLAVVLAAALALPAAAQHAPVVGSLRDTTLANGFQIYVIENHAVPLATAEVVVHNGAMTQDSGMEGVPHLYEHMLFKGYGGGQEEFDRAMADLHGASNGFTDYEDVGYFITMPSKKVGDGVSILGRMLRDPDFDADGLKRERFVVFNEIDRDMAEPVFQLRLAVERRLWSTAWGHKNPVGDPAALDAATPALLKTIYHRYYLPNNAALFVSGDVSPAAVFDAARHAFDGWRAGPDPFVAHPVPPIPVLPAIKAAIITGAVQDVTVIIDWQGPSTGETPDQTYAADVFSTLVNDPLSRVQLHLVSTGLFQDLSMSYIALHHIGPIELIAHTTVAALPRALPALKHELVACAAPGAFDDDALAGSRQARRVAQVLELQSGTVAAVRYGGWWGTAGLDYYRGYTDHVLAVTAADVSSYVATYIEQPYVIGVLGPTGTNDSLLAPLKTFVSTDSTSVVR
jgi:zinc protease